MKEIAPKVIIPQHGTGFLASAQILNAFPEEYVQTSVGMTVCMPFPKHAAPEMVKGTGVTVTALCPGPTATGFEKAAAMGEGSAMFHRAAKPEVVAKAGIKAMESGKVLCCYGGFTKCMNILSRLSPRSVARKFAERMNS